MPTSPLKKWLSMAHENYIALCGHFVTQDWILVKQIFEFAKYKAGHNHQSIRQVALDLTKKTMDKFGSNNITCLELPVNKDLEEWQDKNASIEDDEDEAVTVVERMELVYTTDNAPEAAKVMSTENVAGIPCCGHLILLTVKRANLQVTAVSKGKKNVVNIVSNFQHSNTNIDLLVQEQKVAGKVNPKKPAQEGDTR